jgi:hypothetical protein
MRSGVIHSQRGCHEWAWITYHFDTFTGEIWGFSHFHPLQIKILDVKAQTQQLLDFKSTQDLPPWPCHNNIMPITFTVYRMIIIQWFVHHPLFTGPCKIYA